MNDHRWWIIVSKLGTVFTFASSDGHEPPDVTRWREAGSAARIIGPLMEAPPLIAGRPTRPTSELPYTYRLVATVLLRADGLHADGQGANAVRTYVTNAVTHHPQVTECLSIIGYLHDERTANPLAGQTSGACPWRLRAGSSIVECELGDRHPGHLHQGSDTHGMRAHWPETNSDAYNSRPGH